LFQPQFCPTLRVVLERRETNGVVSYASPLLARAGVPHAFSTRLGGVSPAPFDSLNLGNPSDGDVRDDWDRIHENYRRLQQAIGWHGRERLWVHQVHGGDVAQAREADGAFRSGCRADAIVGDDPLRLLAVRVADCVPILVASDNGRTVAAVHAGWRGVVAGIVPNAVARLGDARRLLAAIGPCIGVEAFEVGAEVLAAFDGLLETDAPIERRADGKGRVDLRAAVRLQLMRAGVPPDRIDMTDRCTHRDAHEFYSHRRERGVTGRMAAVIAPRGA
jgi:YfiH family protein